MGIPAGQRAAGTGSGVRSGAGRRAGCLGSPCTASCFQSLGVENDL